MKTKTYKIIALLFLLPMMSWAQDRNVIWVHGLGESQFTWDIYENLFETERRMTAISEDYPDFNGLTVAANNVVSDIDGAFGFNGARDDDNMAIGHSMGGIVCREVDRTRTGFNQRFGGYITVGSPNDGAAVVNALQNGDGVTGMTDACNRMTAGPLSEISLLIFNVGGWAHNVFCSVLLDDLLEDNFGPNGFNTASHNDLRVGSPRMNAINNANTGTPRISIFGNENSPVHWRLLSSLNSNNANDTDFVVVANLFRGIYNAMFILRTSQAVVSGIFGFFNPSAWFLTALRSWQAIQWKKGRDWLDDSEEIWEGLIGCIHPETVTTTQWFNMCDPLTTDPMWLQYCQSIYCPNMPWDCWQQTTTTTTIMVNETTDGLFCEDAQIIDGTGSMFRYEARGVNHNEETNTTFQNTQFNNEEMRRIFNLIWDRNDFFGTPTR